MPFWRMLKEGNDHFEATRQEPKVDVCEKRYVFDAETSGRFDPRAKCPAFQVPSEIATPVAAKQQRDEQEFATLVARNVPTAPVKTGADGGMNEIFLAKLRSQDKFDENGRIFSLASTKHVPAMGNNVNPPKTANLGDAETTTASVPPPPTPPPHPRRLRRFGRSGSSGSMFGSLFGSGSKWFGSGDSSQPPQAQPAPAAAAPKARPATAAQPKTATAHPSAGAIRPAQSARRGRRSPRSASPRRRSSRRPPQPRAPRRRPRQAQPRAGMMSGAVPVVSSNSFDSRWGGTCADAQPDRAETTNAARGPRFLFPQDEARAAASAEPPVAVLVLLAGAARAVLVAADLAPAGRIARIALGGGRRGGARR